VDWRRDYFLPGGVAFTDVVHLGSVDEEWGYRPSAAAEQFEGASFRNRRFCAIIGNAAPTAAALLRIAQGTRI
jgi:hypothetical protein